MIQLIECPSIYEMLPNPDFKWKRQPLIHVWRKQPDSKDGSVVKLDTYDSTESTTLFEEALKNNEVLKFKHIDLLNLKNIHLSRFQLPYFC